MGIHVVVLLRSVGAAGLLLVEQLLQAVWGFENLRDFTVQLTNDLVDGLLPGGINIFAGNNGIEKLS